MRPTCPTLFAIAALAASVCVAAPARADEPPSIGSEAQLFVDDVMIAAKTGVVRRAHACRKLPEPVLRAETPWEVERDGTDRRVYVYGTVLHDPAAGMFRMWYNRFRDTVLFATSDDGIDWKRPALGLVDFGGSKENNIFPVELHSPSVIRDPHETDPAKRYKMIGYNWPDRSYDAFYSADGLDWRPYPDNPVLGGRTAVTVTQDPATGEFLLFHKQLPPFRQGPIERQIYLSVSSDMQTWSDPELVLTPDEIDHAQARELDGGMHSEFYGMSAFPYGEQWLGLVTHFRRTGPPPVKGPGQSGADGPIDVQLVHSRDGRRWERCSDRSPVIPNGPHAYDAGCILGMANGPVVVGDELWLYYTAITTTHGGYLPKKEITIALAKWRLDGFVSLDAGAEGGTVETVPLRFEGDRLTVNADASGGSLAVEVLDAAGEPIPGYARVDCVPVRGDRVRHEIRWKEHARLPARQPVRLRFHLQNASLYSYRGTNVNE